MTELSTTLVYVCEFRQLDICQNSIIEQSTLSIRLVNFAGRCAITTTKTEWIEQLEISCIYWLMFVFDNNNEYSKRESEMCVNKDEALIVDLIISSLAANWILKI